MQEIETSLGPPRGLNSPLLKILAAEDIHTGHPDAVEMLGGSHFVVAKFAARRMGALGFDSAEEALAAAYAALDLINQAGGRASVVLGTHVDPAIRAGAVKMLEPDYQFVHRVLVKRVKGLWDSLLAEEEVGNLLFACARTLKTPYVA